MKRSVLNRWFDRIRWKLYLDNIPPVVRRGVIAVIGGTVLLFGIALIVLPGPAIVVIPLGLGILATEFLWARRWLSKARNMLKDAKGKISKSRP